MPLLYGKTNQSRLILYTSYPSPEINHLSNKSCFPLGEIGIQRPYPEYQECPQLLSCSPFSMLFRGQRQTMWVFFKENFKNNFVYFILAALGLHYCAGFSLVVVSGATLHLECTGFSLQWLLLLQITGSGHTGSVAEAPGLQAQVQQLCTGLVVPLHVGSSKIRDRTVSPALAGGFLTTEPPGKHRNMVLCF